jgi:hypothetical protein
MHPSQFERLMPSQRDSQQERLTNTQLHDHISPDEAKRAGRRRKASRIAEEIAKFALDIVRAGPSRGLLTDKRSFRG